MLARALENNRRGYAGNKIYICSNSEAALEGFGGRKDKSGLVKDCRTALQVLAQRYKLTLIECRGTRVFKGNERADDLAKTGSARPLNGPEPAVGIVSCHVKTEIRKWLMDQHYTRYVTSTGVRQTKAFIVGPRTSNWW